MIPRPLRLVRWSRELVALVRDLRRVERAPVVMASGPIALPAELPERSHATDAALGG